MDFRTEHPVTEIPPIPEDLQALYEIAKVTGENIPFTPTKLRAIIERIAKLTAENTRHIHVIESQAQQLLDWENREAAVCPEDVGFEEFIKVLQAEVSCLSAPVSERPRIVCLCGSTRFYEEFMEANYLRTMEGWIVLSVGFFMHREDTQHGQIVGCTPEQKIALDELHKRKIDLCDEVYVLNVGGYIGDSTRSEIEYAEAHGKQIRYREPPVASRARIKEGQ
jgi:hypothetical protein